MTNAAQKLIDSFEALPETAQHEVLAQLLPHLIDSPYASLSDEDFTQAADLIFQELDRHEEQGRDPRVAVRSGWWISGSHKFVLA